MEITLTEEDREDILSDFERTKKYLIHEITVLEDLKEDYTISYYFLNQFPDRVNLVIDQIFMPLDKLERNVENTSLLPAVIKKFVLKRKEYLRMMVDELNELSENYFSFEDTFQRDLGHTLKGLTKKLKSEIDKKIV